MTNIKIYAEDAWWVVGLDYTKCNDNLPYYILPWTIARSKRESIKQVIDYWKSINQNYTWSQLRKMGYCVKYGRISVELLKP